MHYTHCRCCLFVVGDAEDRQSLELFYRRSQTTTCVGHVGTNSSRLCVLTVYHSPWNCM